MGNKGSAPAASDFAGIGLQFAASIVLFVFAGQWLDRRLGTGPVFLIVGVFLGAGASFYSMYRKLMAAQKAEQQVEHQTEQHVEQQVEQQVERTDKQ